MNRIKNFLYDTNDIIVVVLILVCAAFVIATRVDAILLYPERVIAAGDGVSGQVRSLPETIPEPELPVSDTIVEDDESEDGELTDDEQTVDEQAENPDEPLNYSLYISYGQSMNEIADNVVKLGFFESRQEFLQFIDQKNASQKVQSGEFIIPAHSTKDEVIRIITSN